MRFYDEMSQDRNVTEIGISLMHVSPLLKQALEGLRIDILAADTTADVPARAGSTHARR